MNELAETELTRRDIVCVGFNDWQTELWTNQHHLMSRLAASGHRVLFIESLGLRRPALAGNDIGRIWRRLINGLQPWFGRLPVRDGVFVLSPLVLPLHSSATVRRLNARLLRAVVRRSTRRLGMSHPILWAYVPQAEVLIETLAPSTVIYHCVDDIAAQERVHSVSFETAERLFAGRADLVLASAPALAQRMRDLSVNVLFAPNVADTRLFSTALLRGPAEAVDPVLAALPAPRIVFTGAVTAAKLDFELLVQLARAHRDWSIALVGPVGLGDPETDVSQLTQEPNIHLLGARPYYDLPAVLRGADVALIPYRRSRLTDSIFPMKVYEYLAAGLPVVATELPALSEVKGIERAADAAGFGAAIARALADDTEELRLERSALASTCSWDSRLEEIETALAAL